MSWSWTMIISLVIAAVTALEIIEILYPECECNCEVEEEMLNEKPIQNRRGQGYVRCTD
jgi:hypothetical protein